MNAKIGTHPDAESLNAFAEQALNAAERGEILAHLAVCGRCREIVSLAQPMEVFEEMPAVAAAAQLELVAAAASPVVARRKPWWRNWRYSLTPIAAMAAIVVVAVAIHERHVAQVAQLEKQAQQIPAQLQDQSAQLEAPAKPEAVARGVTPPLTEKKQTAPNTQATTVIPHPIVAGASNSGPAAVAPLPAESAKQLEQSYATAMGAADRSARTASMGVIAQAPTPAPATPAAAETVEVTPQAKTSQLASALASSPRAFALRAVKDVPLPSGLEKISTATRQRTTVAVDSAGNVFVTLDNGTNWQPVKQQWTGRATRVALSAGGATLELINEQSAVWVSTDGTTWTPR
jgi:hypothetical protein